MVRKKVPSIAFIYNTFNQTYFRYFYGHYVKYTNNVPEDARVFLQHFIDNQFHKLSFSLPKYEAYLLWLFAKYDKLPLKSAHVHLDEYLKVQEKGLTFLPFNVIICKYIRDEKIHSLKEYVLSQGTFYPKIVQHYLKDKNFPFEFLLFLNVFDRMPEKQRKMMKTLFRFEMYNLDERLKAVETNKNFFTDELKKIMGCFK